MHQRLPHGTILSCRSHLPRTGRKQAKDPKVSHPGHHPNRMNSTGTRVHSQMRPEPSPLPSRQEQLDDQLPDGVDVGGRLRYLLVRLVHEAVECSRLQLLHGKPSWPMLIGLLTESSTTIRDRPVRAVIGKRQSPCSDPPEDTCSDVMGKTGEVEGLVPDLPQALRARAQEAGSP